MFRNIKISAKITGLILIISLISVLAIGLFTFQYNLRAARDKYNANISSLADQKAQLFNHHFKDIETTIKFFQTSTVKELIAQARTADSLASVDFQSLKDVYSFNQIYVTDAKGSVFLSTDPELPRGSTFADKDGNFFAASSSKIHFGTIRKIEKSYFVFAGAPLDGSIIIFKIDLTEIFKKLDDSYHLGTTGEIFLAQRDMVSGKIILASPLEMNRILSSKHLSRATRLLKKFKMQLTERTEVGLVQITVIRKYLSPGEILIMPAGR
jgi:hypothetical protein